MESNSEKNILPEEKVINEKVKNKLRQYTELKCLYNISNAALLFKRNISLICQERVEKNLNLNVKRNNYRSGKNPSFNVFNLKDIIQEVFGEYISKHNIVIQQEVEKMELEKEEKEKIGKKQFGSKMQKKFMAIKAIKEQTENNEKNGVVRRNRKNYNYYVVQEKKKSKEKNDKLKQIIVNNCKRKSALDKETNVTDINKKDEGKPKNLMVVNRRNKIKIISNRKEEKKEKEKNEEKKDEIVIENSKRKNNENIIQNEKDNNFINVIKNDFRENYRNERFAKTENTTLSKENNIYKKEGRATTPKKRKAIKIKKQKSYTFRREKFQTNINPEEEKAGRYSNYRNRNKSYKRIEKNQTEKDDESKKKSRSAKKMIKRRRHHRHHHFQHFKKPKRILDISKLDSFSIIQIN